MTTASDLDPGDSKTIHSLGGLGPPLRQGLAGDWAKPLKTTSLENAGSVDAEHLYLYRRILEAWPSYPQMDDFQKVTALRDWTYSTCNAAFDVTMTCLREHDAHGTIYWQLPLSRVLELFDQDQLALRCAGLSHTLMRVYQTIGFKAWYYNHGMPGLVTHCVTLVDVQGEIYLQDPLFNSEYIDSTGRPLSFFHALELLLQNEKLQIQEGPTRWRKVHFPDITASGWPAEHRLDSYPPRCINGSFVHHIAYHWDAYLQNCLDRPRWRQLIDTYRLPMNYDNLLLLPMAVFEAGGYHQDPRNCVLLSRIVSSSGPWGPLSCAGRREILE